MTPAAVLAVLAAVLVADHRWPPAATLAAATLAAAALVAVGVAVSLWL